MADLKFWFQCGFPIQMQKKLVITCIDVNAKA